MANYLVTDSELTDVANAIRAKARVEGELTFSVGFVNAISGITEKAAETYYTSSSDRTIAANQYLAGAQTIKAVTTSNLSAGNIKKDVVVKVGDSGNAGRIANVTGSYVTAISTQTKTSSNAGIVDTTLNYKQYETMDVTFTDSAPLNRCTFSVNIVSSTFGAGLSLYAYGIGNTSARVIVLNTSSGSKSGSLTVNVTRTYLYTA